MKPPRELPIDYKGKVLSGSKGSKWKSIKSVSSRRYEWVCCKNGITCIWNDWCPEMSTTLYPTLDQLERMSVQEMCDRFVFPSTFPTQLEKHDLIEFILMLKPVDRLSI